MCKNPNVFDGGTPATPNFTRSVLPTPETCEIGGGRAPPYFSGLVDLAESHDFVSFAADLNIDDAAFDRCRELMAMRPFM